MQTIFDGTYAYTGYHSHERNSICHITVYQWEDGKTVIVATEIPENKGTSITNRANELATELVAQYTIHPANLTWIEHYLAEGYVRRKDQYSIVTFTWEGNRARSPRWKYIPRKAYEMLIAV